MRSTCRLSGGERNGRSTRLLSWESSRTAMPRGIPIGTGIAPFLPGLPAVPLTRGGLYRAKRIRPCSPNCSITRIPRFLATCMQAAGARVVAPKCLVTMRTVRDSSSRTWTRRRTRRCSSCAKSRVTRRGRRAEKLGLSQPTRGRAPPGRLLCRTGRGPLASNSGIDGMRITSARGFTTSDIVGETGNNVVLFGENMKLPAVRPGYGDASVEQNPTTGMAEAVNFTPGTGGELVEFSTTALP